ncbi:hypothetical protein RRF57_007979 [Xylaria bambusicola]|uniref:Essential protein Yae1 N-terminal domain-containing protein n=1 Tax=Xylaria bambusicola TaxID=326684 RepID=A0AAN7UH11_9PEZI
MADNRPSPPRSSDSGENIGDPFAPTSPSSRFRDRDLRATVETASEDSSPSAGPSSRRSTRPSAERGVTQPIPTPNAGRRIRIPHLEPSDDIFLFDEIEQRRHQDQRHIAEAERLRRARQETHRWQDERIHGQKQARRSGADSGGNAMNQPNCIDENPPSEVAMPGEEDDPVPHFHRVVMQRYAHQYPHTNVQIGYDAGFDEGLVKGRKEGHEEGLKDGRKEGHEAGRKEGLTEGREEGREKGFMRGYGKGYDHGFRAGLAHGRQEAPETAQIAAFINAYQKGFQDGFGMDHRETESRRRCKYSNFASFCSEYLTCISSIFQWHWPPSGPRTINLNPTHLNDDTIALPQRAI